MLGTVTPMIGVPLVTVVQLPEASFPLFLFVNELNTFFSFSGVQYIFSSFLARVIAV